MAGMNKTITYIAIFILLIGVTSYFLIAQNKPNTPNNEGKSFLFLNHKSYPPLTASNQNTTISEFSSSFSDTVKTRQTEFDVTVEDGVTNNYVLIAPSTEPDNKYCTTELLDKYPNLYRCLPVNPRELNEVAIFDTKSQKEVLRYTLEDTYSLTSYKGYYKPSPCVYDTVTGTEIPQIKYDNITDSWNIIVKAYYWDSFDDLSATKMHTFSIDTNSGSIVEIASSTVDAPKEFKGLPQNKECAYKDGNF